MRDQAGLKQLRVLGSTEAALALGDQIHAGLGVHTGAGPGPTLHTWLYEPDSARFAFFTQQDQVPGRYLPAIEPYLAAAAASADPAVQAANYRKAEEVALRDLSVVPLWVEHETTVWRERVHNVTVNTARRIDLAAITL